MTKTQHYQLNQWDPEDRILRLDFNGDNAALDAALKSNADAISSETSNRKSADTKIRTDFAAADNTVRSEFAAADQELLTSLQQESVIRMAEDNAIRSDFAAADDTLRSENMLVKIRTLTTTSDTTQVNLAMSSYDLTQYNEVIIIPRIKLDATSKVLTFRINNLTEGYYHGNQEESYFGLFYPAFGYHNVYGSFFSKMILYPTGENLVLWNSYNNNAVRLSPSKLTAGNISTFNFISAGATILAGSKIHIYGVKV